MILCAGKGTRLGDLTKDMPKALLPVNEKPVVVHIIEWLKKYGVFDIVINLHHLGDKIQEYLGGGSQYEVDIKYSKETELLGTAGGVKNADELLSDTFIVAYGDTLQDFNLLEMISFHQKRKGLMTIALCSNKQLGHGGIVTLNYDYKITSFNEKRGNGLVNAGIYICNKQILNYMGDGFSDFGENVFPFLVRMRMKMPIYGFILKPENTVIDIGTKEGYERANKIYS